MTETQAKSGAVEAPANSAEEEADHSSPTTGRAAVGRATVPANASPPKFTRAPGMAPPPDKLADDQGNDQPAPSSDGDGPAPVVPVPPTSATNPVTAATPSAGGALSTRAQSTDGGTSQPPVGAVPVSGDGRQQARTGTRPFPVGRVAGAVGASRVADAVRAARSTASSAAARGPRRARLRLKRIDPWSVMKFSFVVSFVLLVVVIVATSVLYLALDTMGVFDKFNGTLADIISAGGGEGTGGFQITAAGVIGTSALLGLINMVLFTALATLGAFIYNVCADLVGGIEITLAERD